MTPIHAIRDYRRLATFHTHVVLILGLLVFLSSTVCAQWQPDQRLTSDTASSVFVTTCPWSIAASGDTVHVVWRDSRDGNNEIYYKRSTDGGTLWGTDVRLTNDTSYSSTPCIAVQGALVCVAWNDQRSGENEIYGKRSSDAGEHWGEDVRLTNEGVLAGTACLAMTGSMVHLVWRDSRTGVPQVFYKHSTDGGLVWGEDTQLSVGTANVYAYNPSVAVSDSCVHVVWNDVRVGNLELYYRRSTDGGHSWEGDERLTNNGYISQLPSVAVSDSCVHVVWNDTRNGNGDIYHLRSMDGGVTWEAETCLTDDVDDADWPSICVNGAILHVVWQDTRDGNNEIYYKRSTDTGTTWDADTRLTNAGASAECPTVAAAKDAVHVVWMDRRDSDSGEIYYKRNPSGNTVTGTGDVEPAPERSLLLQNYPNPYHGATTIRFSLPHEGHIRLTVHDLLGRTVATILDAWQSAGSHAMQFDATGLPSGLYMSRIETEVTAVMALMTVYR